MFTRICSIKYPTMLIILTTLLHYILLGLCTLFFTSRPVLSVQTAVVMSSDDKTNCFVCRTYYVLLGVVYFVLLGVVYYVLLVCILYCWCCVLCTAGVVY